MLQWFISFTNDHRIGFVQFYVYPRCQDTLCRDVKFKINDSAITKNGLRLLRHAPSLSADLELLLCLVCQLTIGLTLQDDLQKFASSTYVHGVSFRRRVTETFL